MLRLPEDWVWDSWIADDGDRYHLFFLRTPRALGDARAGAGALYLTSSGVTVSPRPGAGHVASWKITPRAVRWPRVTVETPCRIPIR